MHRRIASLSRFSRVLILLAFASLYTAQNATKPPTIDDVFYHHYAVQISQAPLDPYGFSIFYDQAYRPAHQVLAPPVFLYWWGLGLRLVGNDPTLWKFWLFPFSLLLVVTFHDLARRFARGTELWLTALLLFSPAFLPSLNLMLDIPALALGLAALSLFARASETRSWSLALGAGGLATLSMQTKYTGLLVPPLLLLYAGFARNLRLGSLSVAVSATLFVGWELVVAHLYGTSHFLLHLTRNPPNIYERIRTILALPTLLGSVSIPLLLLAASVLNLPRWARGLLWIFSTGTYLAIGMNYFEIEIIGRLFRLETLLFGLSGLILGVMLLIVLFRVLPANREVWFLAAWLGLEVLGYFVLTPFPAVRRVLGLLVVQTLILGRLASRVRRRRPIPLLPAILSVNLALGLLYQITDRQDALIQQQAVQVTRDWLSDRAGRIWYVGYFTFAFYAENRGMSRLTPGQTTLHQGDWLVYPDFDHVYHEPLRLHPQDVEKLASISLKDPLPVQTILNFYSGLSGLLHRNNTHLTVEIYRARHDFTPQQR